MTEGHANGASPSAQGMRDSIIESAARQTLKEIRNYGLSPLEASQFVGHLIDGIQLIATDPPGPRKSRSDLCALFSELRWDAENSRLVGPRLFLRPSRAEDTPLMTTWLANPSARHDMLVTRFEPDPGLTASAARHCYVICTPQETPIGIMSLDPVDRANGRGEMQKLIGDATCRGKGYGTEATLLWLYFAFEVLNLHKVFVQSLNTNLGNIRLNQRVGMRTEGVLKEHVEKEGSHLDVLLMGVTREEFAALRQGPGRRT
jgi:RimJ/RimL family protein N-acetyltransferase